MITMIVISIVTKSENPSTPNAPARVEQGPSELFCTLPHKGKVAISAASEAVAVQVDSILVVITSGKSEQIVRSKTAAAAQIIIGYKPVHATDGV